MVRASAVLLLALLSRPVLAAQETGTPPLARGMPEIVTDCDGALAFGGSVLERGSWCQIRDGRFANARTLAERALTADPRSYRAHTLIGVVQHLGEANLPRALHHHQAAERLFIQQVDGRPDPDSTEWFVHRITLLELIGILGEMNQHERQIEYVDVLLERLDIDYAALKAWPLIKLRRYDEARAIAMEAISRTGEANRDMREDGLTALCAIESELRRREEAYTACMNAAKGHLTDDIAGGVSLVNAGVASMEVHRFDEAEKLLMEATRREVEGTINPWAHLAHLYVRQGRLPEALSALREMHGYRRRRPPHMDQQDQADAELTGALILLVSGRAEEALRITDRVIHRPERLGSSSAAAEQHEAGNFLMDRVARLETARRLEEKASAASWLESMKLRAKAAWLRVEAWSNARRATPLLTHEGMLEASMRPDCPGSVELPVWMRGELVDVVGPGVVLAATDRARAEETLSDGDAYFQAMEAEAHLAQGDEEEALQLAKRAVDGLGPTEVLLRARTLAIGAEAALALDARDEALALFAAAMQADPGVLRRREQAIPVRVKHDGSPTAQEAADLLSDSPRFDVDDWGFTLELGARSVRLLLPDGSELVAASIDGEKAPTAEDLANAAHERLLSPRLNVTQSDIRSLDGSVSAGGDARERTEDLLHDLLDDSAR